MLLPHFSAIGRRACRSSQGNRGFYRVALICSRAIWFADSFPVAAFLGLVFGPEIILSRGKQLNHLLVKPVEDIVYVLVGDSDSCSKGLALVFSFWRAGGEEGALDSSSE
jgi:hypothetical protein